MLIRKQCLHITVHVLCYMLQRTPLVSTLFYVLDTAEQLQLGIHALSKKPTVHPQLLQCLA